MSTAGDNLCNIQLHAHSTQSPVSIFSYVNLLVYSSEPVQYIPWFLADLSNGRAYATVLRPSVCRLSVCNVMYCG